MIQIFSQNPHILRTTTPSVPQDSANLKRRGTRMYSTPSAVWIARVESVSCKAVLEGAWLTLRSVIFVTRLVTK